MRVVYVQSKIFFRNSVPYNLEKLRFAFVYLLWQEQNRKLCKKKRCTFVDLTAPKHRGSSVSTFLNMEECKTFESLLQSLRTKLKLKTSCVSSLIFISRNVSNRNRRRCSRSARGSSCMIQILQSRPLHWA